MNDLTVSEKSSGVRAVRRSIAVLQAVNRGGSLSLTDIARTCDLPFPTTLRIVRTLVEEGLIEQEPARKYYRPTALVQTLSCGFRNSERLVSVARSHIVALTREVDWPVNISTRVGNTMMVRDSTSAITSLTFSVYHPGWYMPLFASASGRAYFAYASDEEQAELLRNNDVRYLGPEGLMLRDTQGETLVDSIRAQGYATAARSAYTADPGKNSALAVPLFERDTLLGSLSVVFFAAALPLPVATERLLEPLCRTADAIRRDLEDGVDHAPATL